RLAGRQVPARAEPRFHWVEIVNQIGFVFRTAVTGGRQSQARPNEIGFVFRPFLSQRAHSKPDSGFVSPKFCPFSRPSGARRLPDGSAARLARVGYPASGSPVGTPASGLPPPPSLAIIKDCATLSPSGSR